MLYFKTYGDVHSDITKRFFLYIYCLHINSQLKTDVEIRTSFEN